MTAQSQSPPALTITPTVFIGIDWADREHAVCVIAPDGHKTSGKLLQTPQAINEWVAEITRRFPGQTIAIAVEQSKGPLIHALRNHPALVLYPLNPKQAASYRDSIYPSGSKDDPGDAQLLAQFCQLHVAQLRPLHPDSEATRKLAALTEFRRKIVAERGSDTLRLQSILKEYFPFLSPLLDQQPALALKMLLHWPTLAELKRVRPSRLRTLLKEHGLRNEERQTEFIQAARDAVPLTQDPALIEPLALYAQSLARRIADLTRTIAQFEAQIAAETDQHPDQKIFRSLPGAGDALAPRLIAAFGSDRNRYQSADEVQCYSGIAPVTKQSGKSRHVTSRKACPKFLKQTFHEFADHARKWSKWSRAFYRHKRDTGWKHHAAVRALAYKWIRIIFRLWKDHQTYNEDTYITQLKKRNSSLVPYLENT